MELHCGVDLHGDNGFYGIMDSEGKRMFKKRLRMVLPLDARL